MAAMRMKERKGPGMETVSTGGEAGVGIASADAKELVGRHRKAAKKKANVRRRHFIIGYLWRTL
jgi:hypothetical protein